MLSPKKVFTHKMLQAAFAAKYPEGTLEMSARRRYAVDFGDGRVHMYGLTARDLAGKLGLVTLYALRENGNEKFVSHDRAELEALALHGNTAGRQTAQLQSVAWGLESAVPHYDVVALVF